MDASNIKAFLRKARDAIKEKNFKEALKQSKAVLEADKDNYNALVFIGLAAEGLNQPDQALKAFRRASDKDPAQLLAWQGLARFLENNPDLIEIDQAIIVYQKLLALTVSDAKKQLLYSNKLVHLFLKTQQKDQAVEMLEHLLAYKDEDHLKYLKQLTLILSEIAPNLPESKFNLYQQALTEILQSATSLTEDEINKYTSMQLILISQLNSDDLKKHCETLMEKFPHAYPPMEYMLRVYLDINIGKASVSAEICNRMREIISQLLTIKPDLQIIKVGQGFLELHDKNINAALNYLKDCENESISGLYYLSFTNLLLHKYTECLITCNKGLAATASASRILCTSVIDVTCYFKLMKAEAFKEINTAETREKALFILEEVSEKMASESFLIKAYVLLDLGDLDKAEVCASYLPQEALPVQTLLATIQYNKKNYISALKILRNVLEKSPDEFKSTLKLGQTLWKLKDSKNMEDVKQECFNTLLKAAKLDPLHYESFLYLGYFYKEIQQDIIKAKRCFQKAYDLNPSSDETGCALVDALMELGEQSQCLLILEQATSQAAAGQAKWAWLRYGLHQFKQNDYNAAIVSLQSALRGDPNDNHVWECLAEAYLQRGSHNAALKAFTKASELDPDSIYCLHRIANIKHLLGNMTEAVQEYKKILEKSPLYVPVLKGVAESLIQLGKQNIILCMDGPAKDNFEEAILYLTRAVSQRPDLSCLWKLLGDACTFIHNMADSSFRVPVKLLKKSSNIHELQDVNKNEMLKIGARCYRQAIKIYPDSGSLWHDLGVNIYHLSQLVSPNEDLALIDQATQAVKKAVKLEPKDWRHWNALGVIACCSASHKPGLAQHCFIKSIECESSNVVAWTNLGAFYLSKDQVQLAYNAFKTAQDIDPIYNICWIGQAIIAENVGHNEAMDLFRHSTELGFHLESAVGYSHWVLRVLDDPDIKKEEHFHYSIQQMATVPAASDEISRYLRRVKNDPLAYNMQGLLFEHQNLLTSSVSSFQNAISLLEQKSSEEWLNHVRLNLARVLCKLKRYDESVSVFEMCSLKSDVRNSCIYGLALLRLGNIKTAFQVYAEVLALVKGGPEESMVYTALGMVAYLAGDKEQAKSQLFKGFQASQPSLHGLLALCALGLLEKDMVLANAVLEELYKREEKNEVFKDIMLLKLFKCYLEDNLLNGLSELKTLCENDSSLWNMLGKSILSLWPDFYKIDLFDLLTAFLDSTEVGKEQNEKLVRSLAQLLAGQHHRVQHNKNALKSAQKAFHANPGCLKSLCTLATAVHSQAVLLQDFNLFKLEQNFLKMLLDQDKIIELESWCLQMLVISYIETNQSNMAEATLLTYVKSRKCSPGKEDLFYKAITSFLARKLPTPQEIMRSNGASKLHFTLSFASCCLFKDYQTAINMLERLIEQTNDNCSPGGFVHYLKDKLAFITFTGLKDQPDSTNFKEKFEDLSATLKDSSVVLILGALRASDANDFRKAKYLLATALDKIPCEIDVCYSSSLARQCLLQLLKSSSKEQDQKLYHNLLQNAQLNGDLKTQEMFGVGSQ